MGFFNDKVSHKVNYIETAIIFLFLIAAVDVYHLGHITTLHATEEIFTAKYLKKAEYNPLLRSFVDCTDDKHHSKIEMNK